MAEYDDNGNLKAPPIAEWPGWAMWWAMDKSIGSWFFGCKPRATKDVWFPRKNTRIDWEGLDVDNRYNITDWRQSLTSREEADEARESMNDARLKNKIRIRNAEQIVREAGFEITGNSLADSTCVQVEVYMFASCERTINTRMVRRVSVDSAGMFYKSAHLLINFTAAEELMIEINKYFDRDRVRTHRKITAEELPPLLEEKNRRWIGI